MSIVIISLEHHHTEKQMANYFNNFPTAYYTNETLNNTDLDIVTDITKRLGFEQGFIDNSSTYLKFVVDDGDTPETIAHKYYGDVEKHWIVLMMNNIIDPQYDWPLNQRDIIKYINDKYSANASAGQTGTQWAQANNLAYYKVQTRTVDRTGKFSEDRIQVDANTYANVQATTQTLTLADGESLTITTSKEPKTYYDYEIETNENKRTIKLLKRELVPLVMNDLKTIFDVSI